MKIVKILLYILIFNFQAHANDYAFNAQTNIVSALELTEDLKWSLNGGVFYDIKEGISIKESGLHKILLLNPAGEIRILEVNITDGLSEKLKISGSIYIDNKAPELLYSWENIIKQGDQIITGPDSQLSWRSDDPNAVFQIFVNDKLLQSKISPLQITNNTSSIRIQTVDVFKNKSITTIPFKQNFIAPVVDWKLADPSLFKNNKWYSKKKAKLIVSPQPGLSYKLNGKSFDISNTVIKIDNNSQLSANDSLGNTSSTVVSWIVDNKPPFILFETLEEEQTNIKRLNVNTNQDIHLSSDDEGVGLFDAFFFSSKRKWEPLPKTFVFLSSGNYKIKIKSSDKLGNSVKSKIIVRVKKNKGVSK
jgi:hypothetical protein